MKTHELSKILTQLAKVLRSAPDVELSNFDQILRQSQKKSEPSSVALSALVAFSKFTKQQWADLVKEHKLPVEVKSTYSSRDVMGKITNYFADNPEARKRLMEAVEKQPNAASPELTRALSILLKS